MTLEELQKLGFKEEVFWYELKINMDITLILFDRLSDLYLEVNDDCIVMLRINTFEKVQQLIKLLKDE